ncbi:MAG TPA: HNH endonuclease signature motif containing protein [Rhodanobacteraceae bacterium]|nr:HNH endonuclease signature motif containing protein [Rhodanobacteraceae bacterium]
MAFWWVNHKQTRDHEVRGGYLWSPMRNANGAFNQTYENMRLVRPGDVVFSYANSRIGAIGRVTEAATASPKPDEFGTVGDYWSNEGWMVEVDFRPAPRPLRPAQEIEAIGPLLPGRYSPLQRNGHGNQGCYLAAISEALGHLLLALLDAGGVSDDVSATMEMEASVNADVLNDIHDVEADESLTVTQRLQLAKARVGQGLFRKRVILLDQACRVTGVSDTRVLVASHIKPWREASNADRINGHNGILLSPHVDALFDEELITFEDDGRMQVHPSLPADVLYRWSIDPAHRSEPFRKEQRPFLARHRELFAQKLR